MYGCVKNFEGFFYPKFGRLYLTNVHLQLVEVEQQTARKLIPAF